MATVHWQQQGAVAKSETDGHGDTCGPIVIMDYMHLKDPNNWPMTNARLDQLRQDLINRGLMDAGNEQGMTITQIAAGFALYGVKPVKVVPYDSNLDLNQFHQDMIDALVNKHQPFTYETSKAYALPGNQQGVDYHFLEIYGIDSTLGYWTANGDTYSDLGNPGAGNLVWYSWDNIDNSGPCGYIILPSLEPVKAVDPLITLEHDSNGNVTGGTDQKTGGHIGAGLAYAAEKDNLLSEDITLGEQAGEANSEPAAICVLGHRYLGAYGKNSGVSRFVDFFEAAQCVEGAYAQITDLKQQLEAAQSKPAQKFNYDAQLKSVDDAVGTLYSALKENGEAS